ncbi:MAG TPA: hypothetical protein IAA78_08115 [Candidatus Avamphibacillus intestinigallinarum]|nr:hypothetical protein [Candidatus Avamphibacillus intestinigallinarum]
MNSYSKVLLRFAALFGLFGAFLGSHMAGAGSIAFKSVHAHILVVGWLTLFAWAAFYKLFYTKKSMLATIHVATAIIGAVGLTVGMWLYYVRPFDMPDAVNTVFFIVGGSIMLLSFVLFAIIAFLTNEQDNPSH